MHGKHLKGMAVAGGGLFAVLLISGVPFGRALGYAVSLACPLMMVGMMAMMGRGQRIGRGQRSHPSDSNSSPSPEGTISDDEQQHAST